jgi:type III restriction enzyme
MELKTYQSQVIQDLRQYLATLADTPHLENAFRDYWAERGVTGMPAYKNTIPGVPHVCAKVPTAGGKTYIAVNALQPIFEALSTANPQRPKFVVWLVPSLTILEQTARNLSNPDHPYHKRLSQLFKGRVAIYEKKDLLMGAGFSPDTVADQVSIVVMSFDSLRARNKEDRKIFQENGYLAPFMNAQRVDAGDLLPDRDPSALINVIRSLKPVVIVDESHNAESTLSVEMLVNLNPDFILDLTATPRNNSNIISYVDAMALKRHHMVKLPVIVANQNSRAEVIESALVMRKQLEAIAIKEEASKGGRYIRPIVLFQAQPRTHDDNTTFDKVKEKLVALGIPPEEIRIKTADRDEIKGEDLLSRACPVRYIITVNALKEGWDCPFAYILASLADKSSVVDVEQIVGRVLRMPYVQKHGHDLLNLSYVFTASSKFQETLQTVVNALQRAGFSDKDYRALEMAQGGAGQNTGNHGDQSPLELTHSPLAPEVDEFADLNSVPIAWVQDSNDSLAPADPASAFLSEIRARAIKENQSFEEQAKSVTDSSIPAELADKTNMQKMKDVFREDALSLSLPQFFIEVKTGGWFDEDGKYQLLERDQLLTDFRLAHADSSVDFANVDAQVYKVDLEKVGEGDYAPKPFKVNVKDRQELNRLMLTGTRESQVKNVTARMMALIGNMYPIADSEVNAYIHRIVSDMLVEQLQDCMERDYAYAAKIKTKISDLADRHAQKAFIDALDVGQISIMDHFRLPETITPSANAPDIPKSLYRREGKIGDFEARVISELAGVDSVVWWHRNLSRGKGFRINGFINHYPDFILRTGRGKIIVVETKGDDRDNSDSEKKLLLGKKWEAKAGEGYRYMMVFENNPIEGAERLDAAMGKIGKL